MTTPTHPDAPSGQPYSPPPIWQGTLPPPQPPPFPNPSDEPPRKRSWVARHKILTGVLAVATLFLVGGIAGAVSGGSNAPKVALSPSVSVPTPPPLSKEQRDANASAANGRTSVPVTPESKPAPPRVLTPGQENAVGTAKDYLSTGHFSRTGLIDQLLFEDYTRADATFAVDSLHVNWNKQAVGTARDYLDSEHFSRTGLIDQLKFEGYTTAQARYAADQIGL